MTRAEIIDLCLTFPGAYEDYPFKDGSWTAMRHGVGKKIFALIYVWGGHVRVNLKCDPMKAEFLRDAFRGVIPGYHMNKVHWNTVIFDSDVPYEEFVDMIRDSYDLTRKKRM